MKKTSLLLAMLAPAAAGMLLTGCHTDMWRQPKALPQQASDFFTDGKASRLPVAHTVARGDLRVGNPLYTYRGPDGKLVTEFPIPITKEVLKRGQERFNVFCYPCHGATGNGKGMIAQRGLSLKRAPASYHTERLRKMPVGHFFDVITNGYGIMYSYASRIQDPRDRWAIAAYIRALQLSQDASPADVEAAHQFDAAHAAPTTGGETSH